MPSDHERLMGRKRQERFQSNKKQQGTPEVRGIFANTRDHPVIKTYAAEVTKKRVEGANNVEHGQGE